MIMAQKPNPVISQADIDTEWAEELGPETQRLERLCQRCVLLGRPCLGCIEERNKDPDDCFTE